MMGPLPILATLRPSILARTFLVPWQTGEGMAPLPADPPIGGFLWTVAVPAALLIGPFVATYLLYRRFADEED
jgi:hypothetical protein